jgi:DNA polymerase III subunit alpha
MKIIENHPIMGFEHLHRHSDFSLLDGLAKVQEYAAYSAEVNQQYLAITDHGVMGAIPSQIALADEYNLKPIFGCEMYINPLQPEVNVRSESADVYKSLNEEDQKIFKKSFHLLGLAYNFTGYQNLVRLTSWAWIHGFYRKPRINHEMLKKHSEGIIFTSTCGNSEIAQAYMRNRDDQEGFDMIQKYIDMLGRNNFYLELMMLDWVEQKPYDAFLIRAHKKFGLPVLLTQDCHYCRKEHSHNQHLMLIQQNGKTMADIQKMIDEGKDDIFELQDTNLWMKSEAELNEKWESDYSDVIDYELYKQAKANTVEVCRRTEGVELDRSIKLPQIEDANTLLLQKIMTGFEERKLPKTQLYLDRIREEYRLICRKGFASYFLIQQEMTDQARCISSKVLGWGDGSEAVGPGRGSACGSLVAYCLHLHDVEPVHHDLLFSRFLITCSWWQTNENSFFSKPLLGII